MAARRAERTQFAVGAVVASVVIEANPRAVRRLVLDSAGRVG